MKKGKYDPNDSSDFMLLLSIIELKKKHDVSGKLKNKVDNFEKSFQDWYEAKEGL